MSTDGKTIGRAKFAASRRVCRAAWPQVVFAVTLLPRQRQYACFATGAVIEQLQQIALADASEPGSCCGESDEQRRAVCHSVIEHLFDRQTTGKAELDAFIDVLELIALQPEWFEQMVDGWFEIQSVKRYATWKSLRTNLQRSSEPLGSIIAVIVGDDSPRHDQITAACTAVTMTHLLARVPDDWTNGRLLLPLEDLLHFNIRERELDDPKHATDERWQQLASFQCNRVRKLFAAGEHAIDANGDAKVRSAARLLLAWYGRWLDNIEAAQLIDRVPKPTFWHQLAALPRALLGST